MLIFTRQRVNAKCQYNKKGGRPKKTVEVVESLGLEKNLDQQQPGKIHLTYLFNSK